MRARTGMFLNAALAGWSGAMLALWQDATSAFLGNSYPLAGAVVGVSSMVYALHVFSAALRGGAARWELRYFILGDLLWIAATVFALADERFLSTDGGRLVAVLVAAGVGGFALFYAGLIARGRAGEKAPAPAPSNPAAIHHGTDTALARGFEAGWANPTADRLAGLMQPDVVLRQPGKPPIVGREAARQDFRKLMNWLPGLYGVVDRTVSAPGICMIEYRLVAPIGSKGVEIRAVDTFYVKDDKIQEREVYYDSKVLGAALLRHPWHLAGFFRYLRQA